LQQITNLPYLLFFGYLLFFLWLLPHFPFLKKSGLSKPMLWTAFLIKLLVGAFYGWMGTMYAEYAQMKDTWFFHAEGLVQYHQFLEQPRSFFENLLHNPYPEGYSNFFGSQNSFWNDLKSNVFTKFLSVLDIFSFGNYYVNLLFFSVLTFFGQVAIFRILYTFYPSQKWLVAAICFLAPGFLYWTSGLHKDGIVFTSLALVIYIFQQNLYQKKWPLRKSIYVLFLLSILFVLRNHVFLIFIPALLAWVGSAYYPAKKWWVYTTVYGACVLIFFTSKFLHPALNFPAAVASKQLEFKRLAGNTVVHVPEMDDTFWSFVQAFPHALVNTFTKPWPSDIQHIFSFIAFGEHIFIITLLVLFLFFRKKSSSQSLHLYIAFCFAFSFTLLLEIGFTVTNLGAIVRYRSMLFPFLFAYPILQTDWARFFGKFRNTKTERDIL